MGHGRAFSIEERAQIDTLLPLLKSDRKIEHYISCSKTAVRNILLQKDGNKKNKTPEPTKICHHEEFDFY